MNRLVVDPKSAVLVMNVTDLSGIEPSLTEGGGAIGGPETINTPTTLYCDRPGTVLVSLTTQSGKEVATPEGEPARVTVSGVTTLEAHLLNEEQVSVYALPGGWPGDMRPFPGHWYGPRITGTFQDSGYGCYQQLTLTPVTVVDGIAAIGFSTAGVGTSDWLYVGVYNSDRNNWPSTLVYSARYEDPNDPENPPTLDPNTPYEIPGPDVQGQKPTIPDGLYWIGFVSFDDPGAYLRGLTDYNSSYSPVGNAPFPSFGEDLTIAIDSAKGNAGQCVLHATSQGAAFPVTGLTELPTTVTPGVDANGNYYGPIVFVKSAWGG